MCKFVYVWTGAIVRVPVLCFVFYVFRCDIETYILEGRTAPISPIVLECLSNCVLVVSNVSAVM